eukprot:COSAG06_NODE_10409_length_1686_cov_1.792060_1_plen_168_part_00
MPKRKQTMNQQTKPADDEAEYEVECLLEQRASDGKYKVKWVGYAAKDATWEPAENIGAWHLAEFKKKQKKSGLAAAVATPAIKSKKKNTAKAPAVKKKIAKKQKPAGASGLASRTDTLLNVPFKEKDAAKKLGAKWDWEKKKWYVPAGASCAKFKKWLPKGAVARKK